MKPQKTRTFKYLHVCTTEQMKKLEEKSKFFKALGDQVRLQIIDYLMKKDAPVCICDLSKVIKRDPSVIFRHVQLLKDAGIIKAQKDNKFLMCSIKDKIKIGGLLK